MKKKKKKTQPPCEGECWKSNIDRTRGVTFLLLQGLLVGGERSSKILIGLKSNWDSLAFFYYRPSNPTMFLS